MSLDERRYPLGKWVMKFAWPIGKLEFLDPVIIIIIKKFKIVTLHNLQVHCTRSKIKWPVFTCHLSPKNL